jgi:hypothetical protein
MTEIENLFSKLFIKSSIFFILTITAILGMENSYASEEIQLPNRGMLSRIGIDKPIVYKTPSFSVAVVDSGPIYVHSGLSNIDPEPLPLNLPPAEDRHGFMVCSVIHQLHPGVKIVYLNDQSGGAYDRIEKALDNPEIKVINCSFSEEAGWFNDVDLKKRIFKKAQTLKKLLVFSAGNVQGWLGLLRKNRHFYKLANDPETKEAFVIVGGSREEKHVETIHEELAMAGALRSSFIIAPGVDVPVFSHHPNLNGIKKETGTSFAAPYVVASLVYVMDANPIITPYQALGKLYETADKPRDLMHASIADQGWGYLNLRNALNNLPQNTLSITPLTRCYDDFMIMCLSHLTDRDKEGILNQLVNNLQDGDTDNRHVRQLLRVVKFERGMLLLNKKDHEGAIIELKQAKSFGLEHTDPLSDLKGKQYVLETSDIDKTESSWFLSMLDLGVEQRGKPHPNKYDDATVIRACRNGYNPAFEIAHDKIRSMFFDADKVEIRKVISYLQELEGLSFPIKLQSSIGESLVLFALNAINGNLVVGELQSVFEFINKFKSEPTISIIFMKRLSDKLNEKEVDTKSIFLLLSYLFENEKSDLRDYLCSTVSKKYRDLASSATDVRSVSLRVPEQIFLQALEFAKMIPAGSKMGSADLAEAHTALGDHYYFNFYKVGQDVNVSELHKAIDHYEKATQYGRDVKRKLLIAKAYRIRFDMTSLVTNLFWKGTKFEDVAFF